MSLHDHQEHSATGAFRCAALLPFLALLIALWAGTAHPLGQPQQEQASGAHGPVATLSSVRERLLPERRIAENWLWSPADPTPLPPATFAFSPLVLALVRPRAIAAPVPSLPLVLRPAAPRAPPHIPVRA